MSPADDDDTNNGGNRRNGTLIPEDSRVGRRLDDNAVDVCISSVLLHAVV